jgi:hypothetical protein
MDIIGGVIIIVLVFWYLDSEVKNAIEYPDDFDEGMEKWDKEEKE